MTEKLIELTISPKRPGQCSVLETYAHYVSHYFYDLELQVIITLESESTILLEKLMAGTSLQRN
jgi:hypothetical protein